MRGRKASPGMVQAAQLFQAAFAIARLPRRTAAFLHSSASGVSSTWKGASSRWVKNVFFFFEKKRSRPLREGW